MYGAWCMVYGVWCVPPNLQKNINKDCRQPMAIGECDVRLLQICTPISYSPFPIAMQQIVRTDIVLNIVLRAN
eukprot:m.69892 g.69892  ORF g.69892 m.69892 type:complete len:73 (+) comp24151_c0_seq2:116-334(+)